MVTKTGATNQLPGVCVCPETHYQTYSIFLQQRKTNPWISTCVYYHAVAQKLSLHASTCCNNPAMMGCHSNRILSYTASQTRRS